MKLKSYILALATFLCFDFAYAEDPGKVPQIFGQTYGDDAYLRLGKSEDAFLGYNTTQNPDAVFLGVSSDSNNFVIGEKADKGYNFAHTASTDPTLFIQSHNQSATQYIAIYHNGTNGVITTGTGVVSFPNGISAASGAIGGGAGSFTSLDVTDGNITNVGTIGLDAVLSDATTGQIIIGGAGGASNNERLTFDFETTANKTLVTTSTGVTSVDFGTIDLETDALDLSEGNISNVGTIAADSINADGSTIDYNDVNILELPQADLGSTCTLGQISLDTGGAAKELCYCQATNTWLCSTMSAGPTD